MYVFYAVALCIKNIKPGYPCWLACERCCRRAMRAPTNSLALADAQAIVTIAVAGALEFWRIWTLIFRFEISIAQVRCGSRPSRWALRCHTVPRSARR